VTWVETLFVVAGLGLLAAAALPRVAAGRAFSPPMVFVLLGVVLGLLPPGLPGQVQAPPSDGESLAAIEHLTEIVVIVSLFGVGIALDRPFGWRRWASTWRLIALAMPLTIGAVALLGWGALGLAPAAALLLGAVLAPTDPVLASEVQVGEPSDDPEAEDEVRFALTSEAGLNDGLAFPFVYAATLLAAAPLMEWAPRWLAWELTGKIALGVAVGLGTGWALARLAFRASAPALRFAETAESLVALAAVFLTYGLAEALGGYGFLAVFVAAVTLRSYERNHSYQHVLHAFVEQVERLLTLALLVLLGFACVHGLLAALTPAGALVAVLLVLVVRPLTAWVSLRRAGLRPEQRAAVAFFGVRGVGSFYYLSFALGTAAFSDAELLWAVVACAVLVSVVVHGVAAGPVMSWVDRREQGSAARAESLPAGQGAG
jgi:NhaP-type Na+/H+ or K+/H+ antiporter